MAPTKHAFPPRQTIPLIVYNELMMTSLAMQSSQLIDYFGNGAYSQVISLAESLNISPSNDPEACHVLAASYFLIGEIEKAHSLLTDLAPLFDSNVNFLSLYAATCRRQGDLRLSKELFLKALKIDPDSKEVLNNYANLLIDMNQFNESRSILENLINL